MRPLQSTGLFKGAFNVGTKDAVLRALARLCRILETYGSVLTNQLTLAAQPLPFRYKRHAIALLMHGQVAPVAEHNGIRVLAISIVADGAFRVLLFTQAQGFPIHGRCRA
jgi:hypothetical protein